MGRFEAFIRDNTERQAQDAEATLEAVAQVLTPRLRDKFAEEIINLAGRRVRVEMVRAGGQYGSPHYQVMGWHEAARARSEASGTRAGLSASA